MDGVTPSNDTIASESYPLCNEFYAVLHADAVADSPERQLYDWLDTAAGQADMEIRYVNGSKEDNRLSLAGNMQVDAVWTMGLTDGELEAAGLHKGKTVISVFPSGDASRLSACA